MQRKPDPNPNRFPITRFFDLLCVEVIAKFMYYRKSQLEHTIFQKDEKMIIIYQCNELNLANGRDYITVQWWEGYHRFNGEQHPDYMLSQLRRSYYKLHNNTGKVFTTSLPEESFDGHTLTPVSEAADNIVRQFCRQRHALHKSLWPKAQ